MKLDKAAELERWVISPQSDEQCRNVGRETGKKTELEGESKSGLRSLQAVFLIQRFIKRRFRCRRTKENFKDESNTSQLLGSIGKVISGRPTILQIYCDNDINQAKILIYDQLGKEIQPLLVDNIDYSSMTHDLYTKSVRHLANRIRYSEAKKSFYMGLETSPQGQLNVVASVLRPSSPRDAKQKSMSVLSREELIVEEEKVIYTGLKHTGNGYCNVTVRLKNGKGEVEVSKDNDAKKQIIEIEADLKGYLKVVKKDTTLKLGRIIYNAVTFEDKDTAKVKEDFLKESLNQGTYYERKQGLSKLQDKFKKFLDSMKQAKARRNEKIVAEYKKEFGVKMGKQYHLIKVKCEEKVVTVKSNKAKSALLIKLKDLGMKEDIDASLFKENIKAALLNCLAFDTVNGVLVHHVRGIKAKKPLKKVRTQ